MPNGLDRLWKLSTGQLKRLEQRRASCEETVEALAPGGDVIARDVDVARGHVSDMSDLYRKQQCLTGGKNNQTSVAS